MTAAARLGLLLLCLALPLSASPIYITFPSDVDWMVRESPHFRALYPKGRDDFAGRALKAAEKAYSLLTPLFPEAPETTWIVIADWHDSTNGYSLDLPYPHIVLYPAPPDAGGQLSGLDDWLDSLVLHEYVHTLHIYPARGLWKVGCAIFGSWVLPNALMPTHFHEGMATWLETELTEGGRARAPYFRMIRRVAVAEGKWGSDDYLPLDRMDGTVSVWPQGSTPYFFGATLHQELWRRKGKAGFRQLAESYAGSFPFFHNSRLAEVYRTDFPALWESLYERTAEEDRKEIASIEKLPPTELKFLTETRFAKWDLVLSPDGKRVAYRKSHPEEENGIDVLDVESGGVARRIERSQTKAEGICWGTVSGRERLLWVEPVVEANRHFYSLTAYDWADERFFSVTLSGRRPAHIHRIACDESLKTLLVYDEWVGEGHVREFELEWSEERVDGRELRRWDVPSGSWVTSLLSGSPHWIAVRRDRFTRFLAWEGREPAERFTIPRHAYQLRPGANGGELLFLADIDGRNEIWSADVKGRFVTRRVALLGGANTFDAKEGRAVLTSYRHGGFDIAVARLRSEPGLPVAKIRHEPARKSASETVELTPGRSYTPWSTLFPRMWVPTFLIVPNGFQVGAWIPGFDVSQRHYYQILGGYDSRGSPFADLFYAYRFNGTWALQMSLFFSPAYIQSSRVFYDTWGGRVSLAGRIEGGLGLDWSVGPIFRRVESSPLGPAKQNVGIEATLSKTWGGERRAYSISPISGTTVALTHAQYFEATGSSDDFFTTTLAASQYLEAPWWKNHVFYLSARAGYTEGTALYNSFLEGGGELLFSQARGFFLNRGFLPGLFLGRRMFNFTAEYLFPIAHVERGPGLLPAFLKVLHAGLVADTITFDRGMNHPDDLFQSTRRNLFHIWYTSVGAELKADWTFFYYLPAQTRVGAYHGFGPFGETIYVTFALIASL